MVNKVALRPFTKKEKLKERIKLSGMNSVFLYFCRFGLVMLWCKVIINQHHSSDLRTVLVFLYPCIRASTLNSEKIIEILVNKMKVSTDAQVVSSPFNSSENTSF